MKKFILGLSVGIMIMFAYTAMADDIDVTGKTVDGTYSLRFNGRLTNFKPIGIEGDSYIKTMDIVHLLGYDVYYNVNDREISLVEKSYDGPMDRESNQPEEKVETLKPTT